MLVARLGFRELLLGTVLAAGLACDGRPRAADPTWRELQPGLSWAEFRVPQAPAGENSPVVVVRAEPAQFQLRLLNASAEPEGRSRTPRQWADNYQLVAVINAAMYQADHRRSVSLMRTLQHVNNPRLSADQAVLMFDPLDSSLPQVQIVDRELQPFELLRQQYASQVQAIRMLSLDGRNVWEQKLHNRWSVAAIGIDRAGNILFMHSRAHVSVHDLITALQRLPIELKNAMYTEGGAEAQLFVRAGGKELELSGVIEAGVPDGLASGPWPIPNVLGLVRRSGGSSTP